ncbi:MAG TPA: fused MFS/spermidine synthase [Myxococcota bacterium]|nr:fused MFS/spermidine synthase [Myxococcota bacterium]
MRPLVLALFFASGVCALVYEVVWIRILSLTLSITVYALTTVLCAFMAGLAVGAGLGARIADRVRLPLRAFGLAELGIAASGLAVPALLFGLGPAFLWLHDALGGDGPAFFAGRFLLAFGILLVPATLMGVTLPLLSRAFVDRLDQVGSRAGILYGINTLGAVVGCVLAGFAFIPSLGLRATSALAASLNVAVGVGAFALAHRFAREPAPHESARRAPLSRHARLAVLAFGISGFTAMGYEVLWSRALVHFTHNSTYAYTAMLATFLTGLSVGSAVCSRFADRVRRPLLGVGAVQLAVALSVLAALRIYMSFERLVPALGEKLGGLASWSHVVALIFSEAVLTMLATTLLLGCMFPFVARAVVDSLDVVGRRIGAAYVVNTLGSIAGAALVGFVALPALGVRGAFLALVVVNLALGAALALAAAPRRAALPVAALAALAAVAAFAWIPARVFEQPFLDRFGTLRMYREEVTDTVMVTEAADGSRMIRYADGRGTAGSITLPEDRTYAHIPMLLHADPKRVLQIGFGVGHTLSSIAQYPVESITCVELSPGVIEAAPFFRETNRDVLSDPRVRLVINDGRNFLTTSRERYDVIRLDPPELHTAGVVNLYTREFYELAKDHLAPGGIFSIWVNNVMTPEDALWMLVRTIQDVFPYVTVWHGPAMFSWVINGSLTPHAPDVALLEARFAEPAVRADLATIPMRDPFHFLAHYVGSGEQLAPMWQSQPLVEDDHTRLDFSVPRSRDSYFGIANYNTGGWLIQQMEPGAVHDVAFAAFAEKIRHLAGYKQPVVPVLRGLDGLGAEEVERRVEAALETLPVH